MRDKILKVIESEHKRLDPKEIMDRINKDASISELRTLIHELDLMCRDGILRCSKGNTYVKNDNINSREDGIYTGIVDMHEKGNAHVIVVGEEDIFIPKNNMCSACDKDIVLVRLKDEYEKNDRHKKMHNIINTEENNRREGKIIKIVKRSLGKSIGEVIDDNGKIYVCPLDNTLPYEVVVEENNDLNLVDGLLVHLDYVEDLSKNKVLARIDNIICHKNAPGKETEIALIANEFKLRMNFPEECQKEASAMPRSLTDEMIKKGLEEEKREDLRGEVIFTIDGKDTKDIDDAISLKILPNGNYELGVHIADVSHYVKPGMALWKEAELRGNSNYLGNKVIPMLPVELSNGICSLNPNEDRFAVSTIMEINHSGEIVNYRVTKSIIKSKKKMNYDAVEDILENKETEDTIGYDTLKYTLKDTDTIDSIAFYNSMTSEELLSYNKDIEFKSGNEINIPCSVILKNMNVLSKKLSNYKEKRGEIKFESDETYNKFDDEDNIIDIYPRVQRDAEMLIENFMIANNESIADYLEKYGVATYRIHETPLQKKIEDFMNFLELLGIHYPGKINTENISSRDCQKLLEYLKDRQDYKILNKKLLRSMQKARYSINMGHFGIASPKYTHFTSPIRRFDDLLNHTSVTQILNNDRLENKWVKSWNAYLTTICDYISECERNSEKCEREVDDMLKASYMTNHIGEEFEATVDSILSTSFFVQTDKYIEGRVDTMEKNDKEIGILGYYQYDERLSAYTRNGRVDLRYGDRVLVKCINADVEKREVDFSLIRKL